MCCITNKLRIINILHICFNIKRDNYKAGFVIPAKVNVAQHLRVILHPLLADDRSFPLLKVGDFLHTPCHFDRSPETSGRSGEISNQREIPRIRPLGFARNDKKNSPETDKKAGIH